MRDRVMSAGAGLARLVLVVVAFGLAVGSIGVSAVRGFCPEVEDAALAMASLDVPLATVVDPPSDDEPDEPGEPVDPDAVDPDEPAPQGDGDGDAPAGESGDTGDQGGDTGDQSGDPDGEGAPAEGGPCPGQASRCLPPLLSSVLLVGDPICHEQAGARLRGILVPAFVGSTILLAGAWWLRPGRLYARTDRDRVAP